VLLYLDVPATNTISLVFRGVSINVKLEIGVVQCCPELSVFPLRNVIRVEAE